MKNKIDLSLKVVTLLPVVFYVVGFFIWNIFLLGLKFNEIEILQSRFIYTGFFFFIYFCPFILVFYAVFRSILNLDIGIRFLLPLIFLLLIMIPIYSIYIFPRVPKIFGGGRPLALSLLPNNTSLNMKDLRDLGIEAGSGSNIQTENLCVAYENSSIVLVILPDRVIQFSKSQLNGIAALPESRATDYEREICSPLVMGWIESGL